MRTIFSKIKFFCGFLLVFSILHSCEEKAANSSVNSLIKERSPSNILLAKNKLVAETVQKFGPAISPTYEKAVCTELVIQVLEKVQPLDKTDKSRIRIITTEDIQTLLKNNSDIPKGVYFALIEKGIGVPVLQKNEVLEGDFVQFWTETWGHCGIVKSIDPAKNEMTLYSSFPTTNGYGIQKFPIPQHSFFVRLK